MGRILDEQSLGKHLEDILDTERLFHLENRFRRDGVIFVSDLFHQEILDGVREEVRYILDGNAERRDIFLETTGNTPRFMSVVRSEIIAAESKLIVQLYRSASLVKVLGHIAGERLFPCPFKDEEFLITRQDRQADTHGWHWGDFSFALIWIVDTPQIDVGGLLQCVPHTQWDQSNPRINQ